MHKILTYKKDLLALLLMAIIILVFFSRFLDGSNLFFAADETSSDLADFNFPQRVILANHLKHGTIPMWSEYNLGGYPFIAEAQTGVFYPINLLLLATLPLPLAFNWSILTALFLASFGMFAYLRQMKISRLAAFFPATLLSFSGYFMGHIKHVQLLQAAAFFPFILFFIERLIKKQDRISFIFLSTAISMSILAGHIPTSYGMLLFAVVYFLIRVTQEQRKPYGFRPFFLFFGSILLSLLLCSVQLLPTFEMIGQSTRTASFSTNPVALPLQYLVTFISPFAYGDPSLGTYDFAHHPSFWESLGYVGIVSLFTGMIGIFVKKKETFALTILLVVSLFLSYELPHNLYDGIWNFIPGLTFTRIPARFLLFTDIALLALAAHAIEKFSPKNAKNFVILGLFIFSLSKIWLEFDTYYGTLSSKQWLEPPQSAVFLHKDKSDFRISSLNQEISWQQTYLKAKGWQGDNTAYLAAKELLRATTNSMYDIRSVHYQYEYVGSFTLERRTSLTALTRGNGATENFGPKLLGMQNVKYVISFTDMPKDTASLYPLVFTGPVFANLPPIKVYENQQALGRAFFVPDAIVKSKDDVLTYLTTPGFDPKKQVVLERNLPLPKGAQTQTVDTIHLTSDKETLLSFSLRSSKPQYFVLTDTYYPGWVATIDGKQVPIVPGNYASRVIAVPSGTHSIVFSYNPLSFVLGAWISGTALCLLLILAGINTIKRSLKFAISI